MAYKIGIRIRDFRESKGLTQKELAEIVGVQDAVISNWETGRNRPNVDVLKKLCTALNTSADELIGIKRKENKGLSNEAKKVAAAFDDSDDKIKQIIKNIIIEKQIAIPNYKLVHRDFLFGDKSNYILVGI